MMGVYATGVLDMFSDTKTPVRKSTPAIHATLELQVHGQYGIFYEKIARELRYVSELIFPEGQGYEGGWPLVEKDGTLKQFSRATLLL